MAGTRFDMEIPVYAILSREEYAKLNPKPFLSYATNNGVAVKQGSIYFKPSGKIAWWFSSCDRQSIEIGADSFSFTNDDIRKFYQALETNLQASFNLPRPNDKT